ncbi:MAG: hypothetical protein IKB65_09070 [Ruminiclostridium sp.]|nr:hypothetical protein [Ruminiclostridium sp.]
MTMKEMAPLCRKQAKALRAHIRQLREERQAVRTDEAREELSERILVLYPIAREMEELADHMEHYYDRGYCRNEKYTI